MLVNNAGYEDNGIQLVKEEQIDAVIVIGGASVMDTGSHL